MSDIVCTPDECKYLHIIGDKSTSNGIGLHLHLKPEPEALGNPEPVPQLSAADGISIKSNSLWPVQSGNLRALPRVKPGFRTHKTHIVASLHKGPPLQECIGRSNKNHEHNVGYPNIRCSHLGCHQNIGSSARSTVHKHSQI
jgi:hypothetical protein